MPKWLKRLPQAYADCSYANIGPDLIVGKEAAERNDLFAYHTGGGQWRTFKVSLRLYNHVGTLRCEHTLCNMVLLNKGKY